MVEFGNVACFIQQPARVACPMVQDLECDLAVELGVEGEVDHSLPTVTEHAGWLEAADGERQRGCGEWRACHGSGL